jgi:hypothetical protein
MMSFVLSVFVLISLLVLVLIIENQTCIWAVKAVRRRR